MNATEARREENSFETIKDMDEVKKSLYGVFESVLSDAGHELVLKQFQPIEKDQSIELGFVYRHEMLYATLEMTLYPLEGIWVLMIKQDKDMLFVNGTGYVQSNRPEMKVAWSSITDKLVKEIAKAIRPYYNERTFGRRFSDETLAKLNKTLPDFKF